MRIVEINGTNYASTGNIVQGIAKVARIEGFEVFTCCKNSKQSKLFKFDNQIYIGNRLERIVSEKIAELTGFKDSFNLYGTLRFISKLNKIKPDLIHLHIMHDTYINLGMLFKYIKQKNIPVVWTFHDCWAFTGRCPHFQITNCNKWKSGCNDCHFDKNSYPISYINRSKLLWNKKKDWFTNINNCTIVTPSKWLSMFLPSSFFKNYPVKVINNGIDLEKFIPVISTFKKDNNIDNKHLILGVGYGWSERKGLADFIELSKRLNDNYQIVIVGINDAIDEQLPSNIISIHRTYNQEELIRIYSSADVFVNPTKEDNLPTVNIEALACGTPVITYKTGGSPEIIDESCGSVIEKGDIDTLEKEIVRVCETKPYKKEDCIKRAKKFDAIDRYNDYIDLYKQILSK